MKLDELLKMNLQYFADDPEDNPGEGQQGDDPEGGESGEGKGERTFTREEMAKMLNAEREKVRAETKKDIEEKIKEAEEEAARLAKMNEDERLEEERKQLEKELEEYKRKDQFYSMSREASSMLSKHNIQADDELLQMIVKDDAEGTQTAVNSFVKLVNDKVEQGVKEALSGNTPRSNQGKGKVTKNPFSKEHFNLTEQGRLLKDDPELYKQLQAQAK